jgi:hypothetical protein
MESRVTTLLGHYVIGQIKAGYIDRIDIFVFTCRPVSDGNNIFGTQNIGPALPALSRVEGRFVGANLFILLSHFIYFNVWAEAIQEPNH